VLLIISNPNMTTAVALSACQINFGAGILTYSGLAHLNQAFNGFGRFLRGIIPGQNTPSGMPEKAKTTHCVSPDPKIF
jgi:hypothetical protein